MLLKFVSKQSQSETVQIDQFLSLWFETVPDWSSRMYIGLRQFESNLALSWRAADNQSLIQIGDSSELS